MNKFVSLLRLQINARFGLSMARYNFSNNKKELWKAIGMAAIILVAMGQIAYFYTFIMLKFHQAAQALNAPQLILTMGAMASGLFILFFGIFYILGALFLARDTEFLASLPIRQSSVFLSKFILVLLGEYPIALFFMLPPVIIYGVGADKGILYYLIALAAILLLPVLPLVISSLLSLGLMHVVSRSKRRDLIIIVGSVILILAVFLGQNYLYSRMPEGGAGMDFINDILQRSDGLVEWSGRLFPPSVWITKALSHTGAEALFNLVYLLALSAIAFIAVWLLASFIYQKGATAQLETGKKTTKGRMSYKGSSPLTILFKNEWRSILRTPIYALNSLVGIIIGPLIMCMPLFGGNLAQDPDIQALFSLIDQFDSSPGLVLVLAGILTLFGLINPAVSSTYSREGSSLWILKSIPVDPKTQAAGKLIAGYSISLLCVLTTSVVMMFALGLSFPIWLFSVVISAIVLFPICLSGILIDLMRPKLHWNNTNEAIKQNLNVVLGMLVGLTILVALGAISYGFLQLQLSPVLLYGFLVLLVALLSWIGFDLLKKTAVRVYKKIEA